MKRLLCWLGFHRWQWTGCWANSNVGSGMIGKCLECGTEQNGPAHDEGGE